MRRRIDRFATSVASLLVILLTMGLAPSASAHPEGFSGALIIVGTQSVKVEVTIHTRDLDAWFPPLQFTDYVDGVCRGFEKQAPDLYEVQLNYSPAKLESAKAFLVEPGLIQIDLVYPYERELESLKVEFLQFRKLPRGHQQYLVVTDDRGAAFNADPYRLLVDVINIDQPNSAKDIPPSRFPTTLPTTGPTTGPATLPAGFNPGPPPETETRVNWFMDGLGHILRGLDHLLFVAALLLVCRNFKEAATIVTFFTVAHSVTLALSAMKLVNISGDIIEPAIAATIVVVAIENLVHKPKLAWRCAITFFFGLIHGLGFAKDLREKLASDQFSEIVWPLLQFSAGVEAGHLSLVAIALPLLLWTKRTEPRFDRLAVPAACGVISAIGVFWLVTRVWETLHPAM